MADEKVVEKAKPAAVAVPVPFENKIPAGAMDPKDVKPGYGPTEGSPDPSDPTKLFNPNNPNSMVSRPGNPSNPANPPATQSDKPGSEQRIYQAQQAASAPVNTDAQKQKEAVEKEKAALLKEIGDVLKQFGGESSVPPNHAYWATVAKLRFLSNP